MSRSSIIAVFLGFGLILGAIVIGTDNYGSFFHIEGFLIVIGGTMANAFMSYHAPHVIKALVAIWEMVKAPSSTSEVLDRDVKLLVSWSMIAQSKGILALESVIEDIEDDPLLRYGLELVVTGYRPEEIRSMMEAAIESAYERDSFPATILRNMASTAPAFGMVGTLVGMVIMLGNLQSDMSMIGGGLSVALLATLYGVISARLVYLPAAEKLHFKEDAMRFRYYLVTEGLTALASSKGPRYMQDKLNSFLDPTIFYNFDSDIKHHELSQEPKIQTTGG